MIEPEVRLWREVINLAIMDATFDTSIYGGQSEWSRRRHAQAEEDKRIAREWLTGDSFDLQLVCSLADLDHEAVRDSAIRLGARGWPAPKIVGRPGKPQQQEAA